MNPVTQWLAALFLSLASAAHAAETERLNILFCFADDWGRYASCYAKLDGRPSPNQVVRTPNIDRVAREGVMFRNAFVPSPSCTPCRSSLLSGRYFWNTGRGAILRGAVWDMNIPSFPLLLRDSGYHIGKSYKVWSPGTPADAPFGQQQFAYQKSGGAPNNFSEQATRMMQDGMPVAEAREKILAQVRGNFASFLADRKRGQPWLYWFGPTTTHRTWMKGSGKKLWGIDPEKLRGKMPAAFPDVPEVREDLADYLGEAQAYDAYIGELLKALEKNGELERTVIVISGDHGIPGMPDGKCNLYDLGTSVTLVARWPGGRGERVVDDFVNLMDLAPTLLEIGGVKLPAGIDGKSILAQLKSERSGQIDPARTSVVTGRERHVGSAREGNRPYPMRAIRTGDYLYIRNFEPDRWPLGDPYAVTEENIPSRKELESNTRVAFADFDASPTKAWLVENRKEPAVKAFYERAFGKRPGEELYDLRSDPQQMKNVAEDPKYRAAKAEMADRLMKILVEGNDPRVTGDKMKFERPPFTEAETDGPARTRPNARPRRN